MHSESKSKTHLYPPEIIEEVRQLDLSEVAQKLEMERGVFPYLC